MKELIFGITGASGSVYARRTLEILSNLGIHVHLVLSRHAMKVIPHELEQLSFKREKELHHEVLRYIHSDSITVHGYQDFTSPIASGSYKTDAMIICPCTAGTMGRIANNVSTNLLDRAADVCLKERRKLIIVLREMPYSRVMIENMLKLTDAGALILPACPTFYHRPEKIRDVIDSVVARILDHLGLESELNVRWNLET
ncbi:MAG TPA: UbiX family flavin prenyltransferase [Firmicutes bacterium]|nr:UbiX family flavin prenyltransferase [Bacillota bacterium]